MWDEEHIGIILIWYGLLEKYGVWVLGFARSEKYGFWC